MKNYIFTSLVFFGLTGFSFGGDCTNGFCNRASGRVLSTTKTVTKEVVRLPRRVVSGCTNGKCSSRSVTRVR